MSTQRKLAALEILCPFFLFVSAAQSQQVNVLYRCHVDAKPRLFVSAFTVAVPGPADVPTRIKIKNAFAESVYRKFNLTPDANTDVDCFPAKEGTTVEDAFEQFKYMFGPGYQIINTGFTYSLGNAPIGGAFVVAFSAGGPTEAEALQRAKESAMHSMGAQLASWGSHTCGPTEDARRPVMCVVDVGGSLVPGAAFGTGDHAATVKGHGITKIEAVADVKEQAYHSYQGFIESWSDVSCVKGNPGRRLWTWTCTIDVKIHNPPR